MADLNFPGVVIAGKDRLVRPALDFAWRKLQARHPELHYHRRLRGVIERMADANFEALAIGVLTRRFELFVQPNYAEVNHEGRRSRAARFNRPNRIREID